MPILKCFTTIFAVAACMTFAAGCAPAEDEAGTDTSGAAPSAPMEMATSTSDASLTEASGAFTTETLTGTTWAIADYSVTFEDESVVSFNSGSKGAWSLADATITITAAGEEIVITIEGDQLMHNGLALEQQS